MSSLISGRTAALVAAAGLLLTASACDSTKPEDPGAGQEELITQIAIRLQNDANATDVQTITATDADGDGTGLVFSPAGLRLTPGATYSGTIDLNDQINSRNVTTEVKAEAEDHLFRYTVTPTSAATVTVTDRESSYVPSGQDENGAGDLPVGIQFRVVVASGASGAATFNATLFHFDMGATKSSATATSDERDIDINFPVAFNGSVRPAFAGNAGQ